MHGCAVVYCVVAQGFTPDACG